MGKANKDDECLSDIALYLKDIATHSRISIEEEQEIARTVCQAKQELYSVICKTPYGLEALVKKIPKVKVYEHARRRMAQSAQLMKAAYRLIVWDAPGNSALQSEIDRHAQEGHSALEAIRLQREKKGNGKSLYAIVRDTLVELSKIPELTAEEVAGMRLIHPKIVVTEESSENLLKKEVLKRETFHKLYAQECNELIAQMMERKRKIDAEARKFQISNLRLVVNIAKRGAKDSNDLLDRISAGNTGLMAASYLFEARGYKFASYASECIRNQIDKDRKKDRLLRIPQSYSLDESGRRIGALFEEYAKAKKAGRPRLVQRTQNKIAEEYAGRIAYGAWKVGLSPELIIDENTAQTGPSELTEAIAKVLEKLSPRQREILNRRYGPVRWTYAKIAANFDLSIEGIRQIEIKAISKLQLPHNVKTLEPLSEYLDNSKKEGKVGVYDGKVRQKWFPQD